MHDSSETINSHSQSSNNNITKAFEDFVRSFKYWRVFYLIGISDIRKRYARSRLGQFWLTLSMAISITAIGVVYSRLFHQQPADYLPYLATSMLFWLYISSCITDGSNVYILSTGYLIELNIPKLSYINSLFVKNIIILAHNIPVIVIVYLFFSQSITIDLLFLSLLGFIATSIFLFPITVILAIFSIRFRDFPNIIASIIQIAFFVTPIMWKIAQIPQKFQHYMLLNPLAVFLALCRDPLLGTAAPHTYWLAATGYIVLCWIIATLCFSKFRNRITYWL